VLPDLLEYSLKCSTSLAERAFQQRVAIVVSEKIEYNDLGRIFTRQ